MSANTALIQYFTRSPNNGSKARKIIKFLKGGDKTVITHKLHMHIENSTDKILELKTEGTKVTISIHIIIYISINHQKQI